MVSKGPSRELINGPVASRGCTDILFLLLFLAALVLYAAVAYISFDQGDPDRFEPASFPLNISLATFGTLYYTMNVTRAMEAVVGGYFSSSNTSTFNPQNVKTDLLKLLDPHHLWASQGTTLVSDLQTYFVPVCTNSCSFNVSANPAGTRPYIWEGPKDPNMQAKWSQYMTAAQADRSLLDPFIFKAMPVEVCPYEAKHCVPLQYSSLTSFFDRYCLPSGLNAAGEFISRAASSVMGSSFGDDVGDVETSWKIILAMTFGSMVIALIFLWIIRMCVGVFVWISIAAGFLLIIASGILALLYAQKCVGSSIFETAKSVDTSDEALAFLKGTAVCPLGFSIPSDTARLAIQIAGYVLFGLALIYLILILVFRKRIKLAVAINKVASQFIRQNKRSILVPMAQAIFTVGWWALWLVVIVYALTIVPAGYRNVSSTWNDFAVAAGKCGGEDAVVLRDYNTGPGLAVYGCSDVKYLINWQFGYSIGFMFWLNAMILGAGDMIIAGAVGVWYFTPNHAKGTMGAYPLRKGIRNTFIYHLGTVAFGSLILAIMRIIQVGFFWALRMRKFTAAGHGFAGKCVKCLVVPIMYLLELLNRLVAFLSQNAFIQTALMGTNFCTSCGNGWSVVASNAARVGSLTVVAFLVEFVGLTFVTAGTGFAGWALLLHFYDGEIKSPLLPVIIMGLIGFGMALIVLSLFSMSVHAILHCFIIDEEIHKTEGGAKFTPSLLQRFLSSSDARELGIHQSAVIGPPAGPVGGQPISIVQ